MPTPSTEVEASTSYDEIPYKGSAFPQTHPDRLATLGKLFGLTPARVTRCRVLELGCASGGNLIPMAYHLPHSEFVGVDLSGRQVEMGCQAIRDLGLNNIRITHASILDIDAEWGQFDYIICHGVYSWVVDEVQDKILGIASQNLAPQGIAYVSYNTYPGWHMREMIRHMMRYHADQFQGADERISQARALIDFLAESVPADSHYGSVLRDELRLVRQVSDSYLFHEHLEDVNAPIYFHQFVERAASHRLQYLSEADFSTMLTSGFPKEIAATLEQISPDIVRAEQYMDFLRSRFFRQTLLCHAGVSLRRSLDPHSLHGLLVASPARADADQINLAPGVAQTFRTPSGAAASTSSPFSKAALAVLGAAWPRAMDQDTLLQKSARRAGDYVAGESTTGLREILLGDLLHCYTSTVVELRTWQADFTAEVADHPRVSALAAYQVASGETVVNQRHEPVKLDAAGKEMVRVLDGTRNHAALVGHLRERVTAGALTATRDGQSLLVEAQAQQPIQQTVQDILRSLAAAALLDQ